MVAYIDTKFLDAVFTRNEDTARSDVFIEFWNFLCKISNIDVKINIKNPIDYFQNPVYKKLTNGGHQLPACIGDFNNSIYDIRNDPYKLYFIEDNCSSELRASHGLLIINSSEIELFWQIIIDFEDFSPMEISGENVGKLINWKFLENQLLPCNRISICDRYVLSKPGIIAENLFPLVKRFLCTSGMKSPFIIEIFTDKDAFIDSYDHVLKILNDFQEAAELDVRKNVRIVLFDIGRQEHQRIVLSNYQILIPGTSLDFINSKRIKIHEWMHHSFNFSKKYRSLLREKIQRFEFYRNNNFEKIEFGSN
jgi:hypothetical protein